MTARQYSPTDVEMVAVNIETVVATLQMAMEGLPNDGRFPFRGRRHHRSGRCRVLESPEEDHHEVGSATGHELDVVND